MKRIIVGGWVSLALTLTALAQQAEFYVNDGIVLSPPQDIPQVDALNFVNNNFFSVNPQVVSPRPYYTAHTLNYTNFGIMDGNLGFDFSTYVPEAMPTEQFIPALNFHNSGKITVGTSTNISSLGIGLGKLLVSATNIYSPGSIFAGEDCYLNMKGKSVDLSHGLVVMEGFTDLSPSDNLLGFFSGYWGVGTNVMNTFTMPQPTTPYHTVTNRYNQVYQQRLQLANALAYSGTVTTYGGSNIFTRAVFLRNTNTAMSVQVYFPDPFFYWNYRYYMYTPPIILEWKWTRTSLFTSTTTDDYLYLTDSFGDGADYGLSYVGASGPRPTYMPSNFQFDRGGPRMTGETPASANQSLQFSNAGRTNESRAFQALFQPTTVVVADTSGQNATNLPGRMQISADTRLDMEFTRITGPNTMELTATNHFVGSRGAQIAVPLAQITLRNTNGWLSITNLLSPTIPRPEGTIDMYSCRWTNEVRGITNIYHVLFVDSEFSPTSPGRIQDINLSATNLIISDVLNITRNFTFDGTQVTLTTNAPTAPTSAGGINILSSSIIWSTSTPRLSYLTNFGNISTMNAVYFGGTRSAPFYSTNFNEPYEVFINRGTVVDEGTLIWTKLFENSGTFRSSSGSLSLDAWNATLTTNGVFDVPQGDLNLTCGDLWVSNNTFQVGRSLVLTVTNRLEDGVNYDIGTNRNYWNTWIVGTGGSSMPGFSLLRKPAVANLRGTTVSNVAPAYANSVCRWSAADLGATPAGFTNNAAVGRLILDGADNSQFTFVGTGNSNAIYVDYLELKNYTTNREVSGDLGTLVINPNMKVYYAQAVMNGVSFAEKLNGRNNGRLRWVSTYADGFFSSTNVVYPDGTTNQINAALVGSSNLDSDDDGLVNSIDPTPILRSGDIGLKAERVSGGQPSVLLSWRTVTGATNSIYCQDSLTGTNWQLLWTTNYSQRPPDGRATLKDPINATAPRYYRVRVAVPEP